MVSGTKAGKQLRSLLPRPSTLPPPQRRSGPAGVSGRVGPLSPPPSVGDKREPQRRGALRRPREAGVARTLQPPPLRGRLWPARSMGAARRAGRTPGRAKSGHPGAGASLPDPSQPPRGPGARSLPRLAARAMASGVRFGSAVELLPGQFAPARARLVSGAPGALKLTRLCPGF